MTTEMPAVAAARRVREAARHLRERALAAQAEAVIRCLAGSRLSTSAIARHRPPQPGIREVYTRPWWSPITEE